MAVINQNQRVTKRQKMSSFRSTNKSAGFDSGFMSHFNQKPVRIKRKNSSSFFTSIKQPDKPWDGKYSAEKHSTEKQNAEKHSAVKHSVPRFPMIRHFEEKAEKKRGSGFSFSIPSLATLSVIAGTVVIALAALNWENFDIRQPQNYAFQPAADTEAEQHTLQYAATGISAIMPSAVFQEREQNTAQQPQNAEENTLGSGNDGQYHELTVTFKWQEYRVQRGDSVSVIAKRYGVSVGAIIASNEIRNARTLQEGALIKIPNIDGIPYTIKNGDSLSRIAASFNVPLEVILDVNDIKSDRINAGETIFIPGARMNDIDLRMSLGELFMYPVQAKYITSHFGMRKDPISGALNLHTGIDLRANIGTTVMASLDGIVSVVSENWLYGKHIIISHDNGYKTLYAHLNSFSVKQGDRVARGRKIGESGNTGYSTGPHLHFGMYDRNNKLVNPLELLN
jgi:murein DD-endopeptidase MepM/ murein hydrolase activator NlpD